MRWALATPQRANALAVHALWIGLAAGVLTSLLMLSFGPAVYAGLGGRGEALAQAVAYSNVAFFGSIGVWLMNTFASVLRGSGNMVVPSATFLVVSLAQVLIGGALGLGWGPLPRLGMPGVAAGQVIAFSAGAAYLYYVPARRPLEACGCRCAPRRCSATCCATSCKVGALACISPLQIGADDPDPDAAGGAVRPRPRWPATASARGWSSCWCRSPSPSAWPRCRWWAWPSVPAWWRAPSASPGRPRRWPPRCSACWALVLAIAPDLWTRLFTQEPAVVASAALYFRWAGPFYGLFGLGLCLYFSSLGAGKVGGPVLAGTLRLVVVAVGGWILAHAQAAAVDDLRAGWRWAWPATGWPRSSRCAAPPGHRNARRPGVEGLSEQSSAFVAFARTEDGYAPTASHRRSRA